MPTPLVKPAVIINDVTVGIKPDSMSYTEGFPEAKVRTASYGGDVTETVYTENMSTKNSMVKFTLYSTAQNIALHRQWRARQNANTVSWVEAGVSRTITNAGIVNKTEIATGFEGEFEVEFQGDSAL